MIATINGQDYFLKFCKTCLIAKDLRVYHCPDCGLCIIRHDHHCPWLSTCIGLNNHKDFMPFYNEIQGYKANSILVNVWNFGPDWKISIKENGHELNVSQIMAYDPLHIVALSAPRCKSASASSTPSFLTSSWNHFFLATASSANSTVIVTVTDENGRSYSETMVRPKAFKTTDYTNK